MAIYVSVCIMTGRREVYNIIRICSSGCCGSGRKYQRNIDLFLWI